MSNNLLLNPIEIDAIMSGYYQASILAINQRPYLRIEKIYWFQPANVGDQAVIEDLSGNFLFQAQCEVASQSQVFDWNAKPKTWKDFRVTNLGSGRLYIYFR